MMDHINVKHANKGHIDQALANNNVRFAKLDLTCKKGSHSVHLNLSLKNLTSQLIA